LVDYDTISVNREESFLKLIELYLDGTIEEFVDPKFILNYILMSKKKVEEKIEFLKTALAKRFNSLTEYS